MTEIMPHAVGIGSFNRVPIGTRGRVAVRRGKLTTEPAELATSPLDSAELDSAELIPLYRSADHTTDFLDCMRSRELPICDVEIGHRSATVCHLGNLTARLGRPVKWDPTSESCPGDAEAQLMIDRPYRAPWTH